MRLAGGEAFRMRGVGRGEHGRSRRHALPRPAVVNVGRREQAEAGVMVLGVVPGKEDVAVGAGIVNRGFA